MSETTLAWHFVGDTLRDGRPVPPDGEWLVHDGPIIPCKSGLHASERLIDALKYAPGSVVCRVEVRGDIQHHDGDKLVARERCIIWRADATDTLRRFARLCALDVAHLWDMPAVVRKYLETGDERLRAAARDAARDAAWAAARDAAWAAAGADARAAAGDAAWDAAWAAAGDAAWDAHNTRLTQMIEVIRPRPHYGAGEMSERKPDLYETMARSHPSLARGQVWCRSCGFTTRVNSATALRRGWPVCCGYTMTIDAPEPRPAPAPTEPGE